MMKVGIDVSQVIYGTGVSDYTTSLLQNLPQEMTKPIGFSLHRQRDIKKIIPSAITYPIPPSILNLIWNQLHILPIEIFTGKIDVFHSSDWTQPPSNCPTVTTIHDLSPFIYQGEINPQIIKVHKAKMSWALKECSHFICVSNNTATDLQKLFAVPNSKITVIYEAIPTKLLLRPHPSPYKDYLLAIGSLQPRKNIPRLISAYLRYKNKYQFPSKLIIIGESSLTSPDKSVIFTGYIPDQELVNLLSGAKVLIYPSIYEGFGLPVLAGFYYHIPVVAANTSSLPEVAGNAAILVNPYSEDAIAEGISRAVNEHERLVNLGAKQLKKFSWEKTALETIKVYQSLC